MVENLLVSFAGWILDKYGYQYAYGKFDGPVDIILSNPNMKNVEVGIPNGFYVENTSDQS